MRTIFFYVRTIILLILTFSVGDTDAFTARFSEDAEVNVKAEVNYSLRMRTENTDQDLATTLTPVVSGDAAFEKNDIVNNKMMMKMEMEAVFSRFVMFFRGDLFYDQVYDDNSLYDDYPYVGNLDTDEMKDKAALDGNFLEYYLQGDFGPLSFRLGKQVVQWGEMLAPINAITVNTVSPYDMSKVACAGYTSRDYQVPSLMARINLEMTDTISAEAVYNPEFLPRDAMPVVGTFDSYTDVLGYGAANPAVLDDRPDSFKDKQQYGGNIKKVFPGLNMLQMGLYYYHHLYNAPSPVLTADFTQEKMFTSSYEEINMYGLSLSYCFDSIGLQVGGEVAYRPDDVLAREYIVQNAMDEYIINSIAAYYNQPLVAIGDSLDDKVGGYYTGRTLNWGLSGSKIFSDFLGFTPYTFTLTLLFEVYGSINLDYDDHDDYFYPEHKVYYMVQLPISVSDMIDNTLLTFEIQASGAFHEDEDSVHKISSTIKAKYGDHLELLLGYDVRTGNSDGYVLSDRDAALFMVTWYFL